MTGHSA